MIPYIEQVLYTDPQASEPAVLCRRQGGEACHSSCLCAYCEDAP